MGRVHALLVNRTMAAPDQALARRSRLRIGAILVYKRTGARDHLSLFLSGLTDQLSTRAARLQRFADKHIRKLSEGVAT